MMEAPKPAYRPTHVVDSSSYDNTRGTHRTKQVHYVLADGTKSYVELPLDNYNAETVKEALDKAALEHASVMELRGTTGYIPSMQSPWEHSQ